MSQARNLLEIWDTYSKHVLVEKAASKKADKLSTKPGPAPLNLNDKKVQGFAHKNTGPAQAQGFNKNIIDIKTMNDKQKKDNAFEIKKFTLAGENFDTNMEKSSKAVINNNMKSIFDKLFEEVMDKGEEAADLDALGVGADDAGLDMGDDSMGDDSMGGDEVTVTLTADQADCLRAILAQIDGMGDENLGDEGLDDADLGDDLGDDLGGADEEDAEEKHDKEDSDDEPVKKESTIREANMKSKGAGGGHVKSTVDGKGKALPDKVSAMTGKNNKVGGKANPKGSKNGHGSVASTVDGKGQALPDSAGAKLMGKDNKVAAPGYKQGDFFK